MVALAVVNLAAEQDGALGGLLAIGVHHALAMELELAVTLAETWARTAALDLAMAGDIAMAGHA